MRIKVEGKPYVIIPTGEGYSLDNFHRAAFTRDEKLIQAVTDPDHPDHQRAKHKFINLFFEE